MTPHHTYVLSNLSVNQFIEFQVAQSDDMLTAARARLRESGLADDVQSGFFVSVYPTGSETIEEDLDQHLEAAPDGSLASAAAQGPMGWSEDPQVDPPGARPGGTDPEDAPFVVVPLGGSGGH